MQYPKSDLLPSLFVKNSESNASLFGPSQWRDLLTLTLKYGNPIRNSKKGGKHARRSLVLRTNRPKRGKEREG